MKKILVVLFVLIVLLPAGVILFLGNEGKKPSVVMDLPSLYVKKNCLVRLILEDEQTGLRNIYVSIMQKDNEKVLLEKQYDSSVFSCVLPGSYGVVKQEFSPILRPPHSLYSSPYPPAPIFEVRLCSECGCSEWKELSNR